jgi:hypothetical protein
MYIHDTLPKMPKNVNPPAKYKISLCQRLGFCTCAGDGFQALQFMRRFTAFIKPSFTPPRKTKSFKARDHTREEKGQHQKLADNRNLLDEGFIVVRLFKTPVEDLGFTALDGWGALALQTLGCQEPSSSEQQCDDLWVQIGYVNFNVWGWSFMRLMPDGVSERGLQRLLVANQPYIKHSLIGIAELLDFQQSFQTKVYTIISDDAKLSQDEMVPNWVLVKELSAVSEFCVWLGSVEEQRIRDAEEEKRRNKSAGKRKRCDQQRPSRPSAQIAATRPSRPSASGSVAMAPIIDETDANPGEGSDSDNSHKTVDLFGPTDDEVAGSGPSDHESEAGLSNGSAASVLGGNAAEDDVFLDEAEPEHEVAEAEPEQARAAKPREKDYPAVHFAPHGEFRFNVFSQTMTAVCTDPRHAPDCRRGRTVLPSARAGVSFAGQGRPVGLLAAWLMMGDNHADSGSHKKAMKDITLEMRQAGRAAFLEKPDSEEIALFERAKRPGEDDEPGIAR